MYFKKLEIFGFKSFAEKTLLNFEPGVTAVVGPNGCGKSNIFDSIRWVLGEQSIKELRGSSREDVIFNGTDKKPALGFAEVSVTFSNESRTLPIDYDEVQVTRRLFRSGESEYLLNKTTVRLKDIQELLMGTGIGAQAYSMVQQGRVDLIVSAKPEDRRVIFDEAAGITKYKAKKREALNKLKNTEDNLLRVNDIVTEVKRQIGSIERQANKARKYKDEFERLKTLELKIAEVQMSEYVNKHNAIKEKIEELQSNNEKLVAEHEELNNLIASEIDRLAEFEEKVNEMRSDKIRIDGQIDVNTRQIGFNEERIKTIEENTIRLNEQKEQLKERCKSQQQRIDSLKEELALLEASIKHNDEKLEVKKGELESFEKTIQDAKDQIKDNEEKILQLSTQQMSKRNQLTDIMKETQSLIARKKRLEADTEKGVGEKQEIEEKFKNVQYQLKAIEGTIGELSGSKEDKDNELQECRGRLRDLKETIKNHEKNKLFMESQKEFIEKMNAQYEGMPDPVVQGKFITDTPPEEHHNGIIGKVIGVEEVKNSMPLFFKKEDQKVYEIICETKFIELDLQQLIEKIDEIAKRITQLEEEKQRVIEELQIKEQESQQIEQDIHTKEKSFSVLESQKSDIESEMKKLDQEMQNFSTEQLEIEADIESIRKKEEEINYELDTVNQDLKWCQSDIKDKQDWIAARIQSKEDLTVAIAQLETELQAGKDKVSAQQNNITHFSDTLDGWLGEINEIDTENSNQQQKIETYKQESEDLKVKIAEINLEKENIDEKLTALEAEKNDLSQRINSVRSNLRAIEQELDSIKQEKHHQQMQEQELSFTEKGLKDRLFQSYKIDYDEIMSQGKEQIQDEQQEDARQPFVLEEAVQEANRLRKRCESFGNVNLDAMDEYEEFKQRFEFLTQQQSDLLESKSQLMSTINKINRSTRQMFMDTFTKVGEEFRIHFRMLFGGGEAELVLLDPDNVLESGIDIVARPPGKKLQNISLLSGGEKTMTAIALIFGVFKVNPSPFCILDEIDAALDESNVGRFSYMVKEFAKIAQFIVITHNKKTIEASDVMYGITMPEKGISRIVSVKLSDDEKKEQEQVAAV